MSETIHELAEMFISAGNNVVYESAEEIGYLIKDALEVTEIHTSDTSDGLPVNECGHTYEASSYHGPVRRTYTGLFCPDCGARIEAPGKTRPFKLKPHQR